jgi:hypothetical protein
MWWYSKCEIERMTVSVGEWESERARQTPVWCFCVLVFGRTVTKNKRYGKLDNVQGIILYGRYEKMLTTCYYCEYNDYYILFLKLLLLVSLLLLLWFFYYLLLLLLLIVWLFLLLYLYILLLVVLRRTKHPEIGAILYSIDPISRAFGVLQNVMFCSKCLYT